MSEPGAFIPEIRTMRSSQYFITVQALGFVIAGQSISGVQSGGFKSNKTEA